MGFVGKHQLVTVEDLEVFKKDLINAVTELLAGFQGRKEKKWLKSAAARKAIGISPGKLQAIRESGILGYSKIGGNIYYDQDELYALFDKFKTKAK